MVARLYDYDDSAIAVSKSTDAVGDARDVCLAAGMSWRFRQ